MQVWKYLKEQIRANKIANCRMAEGKYESMDTYSTTTDTQLVATIAEKTYISKKEGSKMKHT